MKANWYYLSLFFLLSGCLSSVKTKLNDKNEGGFKTLLSANWSLQKSQSNGKELSKKGINETDWITTKVPNTSVGFVGACGCL